MDLEDKWRLFWVMQAADDNFSKLVRHLHALMNLKNSIELKISYEISHEEIT